jgi:hypothetical protein
MNDIQYSDLFFPLSPSDLNRIMYCMGSHLFYSTSIDHLTWSTVCVEWYVSLVWGHDWLTNEILFVLFCSVDLDRVHRNIKEGAYQGCDTFGEGRIRISIVPDGTHTTTSLLVRAMNGTNEIARYTTYQSFSLFSMWFKWHGIVFMTIDLCNHTTD